MKRILNARQTANTDLAVLIARLGIAGLMLTHGIPKMLQLFSGEPVQFPGLLGMSPSLSLALAVFAEVFCSVLIAIGFRTRLAVIPLAVTMLVALLFIHAADPFAKQEPALHYLLVYVVLFITGSGKYSVDHLLPSKAWNDKKEMGLQDPTVSIFQ